MSRNLPYVIGLILVALTLGLVAPGAQDAAADGSWVPIFDDDFVASVGIGDTIYIALPHQFQALGEEHQVTPTLSTLGEVILNAPNATSATAIVMHGCEAAGDAASDLEDKGYDTATGTASSFPGVSDDMVYTD